MKTRSLIGIFISLAVVTFCFATDPSGKDLPPKIESCIQFPGTNVPQPKLDKIIKVLQADTQYPQNYRVRAWNNGQLTRDIGQMQIKKAVLAETDNYAKSSGLTSVTIQVGICDIRISCSTDCPKFADADRLVHEISPILKKYSR